ncbi:MAG: hypothetical protein JWQ40_3646 [Segetibacter sp.]|nr:hypothetical protein [Segetibacter sp.]
MKKLTLILLLLIYGVSSSGMSITVHYCMSEVAGWKLSGKTSSSLCASCGMEEEGNKGCCRDETKIIKSENDQQRVEMFFDSHKVPVTLISSNYSDYNLNCLSNTIEELPCSHAPLCKLKVPVYISNCVFRI